MSVRRSAAVVNQNIELRLHIISSISGQYTDPYEITKVEILDTDRTTILETITSITRVVEPNDLYNRVITQSSWNTTSKKVYDKWYIRMEEGGTLLPNFEVTKIAGDGVCVAVEESIGYSFDNYVIPSGAWGVIGTPDDIRNHWLFGVDFVATNKQEVNDTQLAFCVQAATEYIERILGIDIRKRIYQTNPEDAQVRGVKVKTGVDYTDEEDVYPFRPETWRNFGFVQLKHIPVLSIERAKLYSVVHAEIYDMLDKNWVRLEKKAGQLYLYPQEGSMEYGPPGGAIGASWLWLRWARNQYPGAFEFDYTTGYYSSDYVPHDLRNVIMKVAAIATLQWLGDGLLAGFSSSSISLDGLSESFSSTQSATSIDGSDTVVLKRKENGELIRLSIGRAYKLKNEGFLKPKDYRVLAINPDDIKDMQWKDLLDVVEHNVIEKGCFIIDTQLGSIGVTEDHSLFQVINNKSLLEKKGKNFKKDDKLAVFFQNEVGEDRILGIVEYEPEDNRMYDLSVEGFHNFIVNDYFVASNSSYFGARILSYNNEVKLWIKQNRFKFCNVPISFI